MSKPKNVSYQIINPKSGTDDEQDLHALLREIVDEHHEELCDARIALAWNFSWKTDVDGRLILGKCKKASDLDRELAPYDFVIILNEDFWRNPVVTDAQRRVLLDHELCHACRALDDELEPVIDVRGRPVFRIRKHDIEEFTDIVQRHGIYLHDLERFAKALEATKATPLFPETPTASGPELVQ